MNFLEIVDETLFDRFGESRRASIKRYVNSRYGRVWAQEAWSFKRISVPFSVTAGTNTTTLASLGLQRLEGVYRDNGTYNLELYPDTPQDLNNWSTDTRGNAYGYSVLGDTLTLETSPSSTTSFIAVGEKKFSMLVNDSDIPLLPEEFHMILVHGAASEALRLENDPTWQGFEQDYQAYLQDMKMSYLTAVRTYGDAYPAWVPTRYGN